MEYFDGQFRLIVLQGNTGSSSFSLPGPRGLDVTSSAPSNLDMNSMWDKPSIQIMPRPNEQEIDQETLKSPK